MIERRDCVPAAGDGNNNLGVDGGAGGGVIFVRAGSLSGGGDIAANGASALDVAAPGNDAGSGGGAGGSIHMRFVTSASCGSASARGGNGSTTDFDEHGPGAGGGGGRIMIQ